jgi:phosphoribosylformylglycinamidine synthase
MQKRPNVQVGDPFLEKLLLEACLEAMATGAIVGIQDMGAAGLTCSTCEMGSRADTGVEIELDLVPQRETGMVPYEIMLSESQERMLLVAQKGREEEVQRVYRKWGLDAVVIGFVTNDGMLRVKQQGEVVVEIPNRALADEAPLYDRPHDAPPYRQAPLDGPAFESRDLQADLKALLSSGNLCSKRWIWEQYDYMVRTNTVLGPGADAAVIRIKETGTSVAMSLDGNGRYCALDPRAGARLLVAEACRNLSATGALPVAATNNLNFGNPERPEIMRQLVEAIEGMGDACSFFGTPITGGNVSLYNETLGEAISPTPVIGVVGLLKTGQHMGIHFRAPGRDVFLIGGAGTTDSRQFGSSEYASTILKKQWGTPPVLDMDQEKRVQSAVRQMVEESAIESAHDVSDGGLAVALAESAFGGIGADVAVVSDLRPEYFLFHEAPSRIIISTADAGAVTRIAAAHRVDALRIGVTIEVELRIGPWIACNIQELRGSWESALEEALAQ